MSSRAEHRRVTGDQRRVDNIPQIPPPKNLQTASGHFQGPDCVWTRFRGCRPCAPVGRRVAAAGNVRGQTAFGCTFCRSLWSLPRKERDGFRKCCSAGMLRPSPRLRLDASQGLCPCRSRWSLPWKKRDGFREYCSAGMLRPSRGAVRRQAAFPGPDQRAGRPRPLGTPGLFARIRASCPDAGGGRPCPRKEKVRRMLAQ